jgi:cell division septation protein DedD
MDEHVPMEQRKQAVALAAELASQTDATRARQLAAADLGSQVPSGNPAAAPVASPPPRAPTIASAGDAVGNARRVAGSDSPATAGADYARPATDVPKPIPPQAAAPPRAATPTTPRPAPIVPRPAPAATAPITPAPAASGTWRIQLGAFGTPANADALWAKVKGRPELAGHPRLNVKAGAVTKLQAGGYASQQAAQAACGKLQAAGYTCLAVKG